MSMHWIKPPSTFIDTFEEDLVTLQADIGKTFIDRVVSFRHPYVTGRLRASWRINKSRSFFDIGPGRPGEYKIYPSGRIKTPPYEVSYITNGVSYGGLVDQGIGMQYARNFVRPALKYTVRQFR